MSTPEPSQGGGRLFLTHHLPFILYALAILVVSSLPQLRGPNLGFAWSDKLLHFAEYAIFAVLVYRSFSHLGNRVSPDRAFWLSVLVLSTFAVLDELHQRFIPGRDPELADLAGDLLGGLVVLVLMRWHKLGAHGWSGTG